MADLNFTFSIPDDETLARYISIKGEKGEWGGATKTSELENDSDFTTNAALNSGLATKADATTVQSLQSQVSANTESLATLNATRIYTLGGTGSSVYYYPLATFDNYPTSTTIVNIHGKIGGYSTNSENVDITISHYDDTVTVTGDYFTKVGKSGRQVDFVLYYDESTEVATLYMKATSWFMVDFKLEVSFGSTNIYDGTYSSSVSGTQVWSFQDDANVQINYNGVIHGDIDGDAQTVNGHTVETDVPYGAVFTDTVYDDTSVWDELDLKAYSTDVAETYATKAEVQSLISATPIPVSSTSEMTDTSQIYVNTSDGYWYYYDGSDWVQGGVYQASEDSTTVDGLVNNQIEENLKYVLDWSVGNLQDATGNFQSWNYAIVTADIQQFSYDIYVPYNSYVRTDIWFFNDDDTFNHKTDGIANASKGFKITAGTKFKIRQYYNTVPSTRPDLTQDTIENSLLFQNAVIMPFSVYRDTQLSTLRADGYQEDLTNLKYSLDLQIGDIDANGVTYASGNYRRIATDNILYYDYDIILPEQSNFMVYLWTYSAQDGSGASGQGWKYLSSEALTIAAGTYFRLLFVNDRDSTTPLYDIYDNSVFKAIEIYKKTESAEPVTVDITQYNPNMRSVAHQGYSTTSETYGNCRLSSYVGAKTHGFDYAECDLQWTSDMIPVCSHDASFDSNGTTVVISEHTLAELKTYTYYGETIASFEEVLAKCKILGLGLYIDKSWFDQTHFNIMSAIVDKYQMQDNVYWLLQGAIQNTFNLINSWYSKAKYVIVLNTGSTAPTDAQIQAVVNFANGNKTVNNYISIDVNHNHFTTSQLASLSAQLTNGVQLECWTIDNATRYKEVLPYLCGITSNKICYNDVFEDLLG